MMMYAAAADDDDAADAKSAGSLQRSLHSALPELSVQTLELYSLHMFWSWVPLDSVLENVLCCHK